MKWATRTLVVLVGAGLLLGPGLAVGQESDEPSDYEKLLRRLREDERVRQEYKQRLADHYYGTAAKRFDERLYTDAERNLVSALEANPNHAKAKELLAKVRKILRKTPAGEVNIIDLEGMTKRVRLAAAEADVRQTISGARQLLKEDKFGAALEKLNTARDAAKVLATHVDVSRELIEIKSLAERAEAARNKAEKEAQRRQLEEAKKVADSEQERLRDLHRQRINRLFEDAKQLYQDTRYLLAANKAEEILKIDPRNEEVMAFRDKCHEAQVAEDLRWYERTQKNETAGTWRSVRKLAIPFTQVQPRYPDNWDEIRRRTAGIRIEAESEEEQEWRKELNQKLDEPVSFDFIATPLDDVVAFLRTLKDVNIVVDKQAVAELGGLDVTLRLDKVKFKDALEWVLRLLNLRYALENGVIFISTKEKIGQTKKTSTRFYDVTDLTVEIRNFRPNLRAISNADLDEEEMDDIFNEEDEDDGEEADRFTGESLVEFIKSVIAPGTWDEVAGGDLE